MNENKPVKHGALWTVLFAVVSLFWIFPIVLVLINSFKQKAYISKNAFSLPAGKAFVGLENYVRGIETTQFFASFGWTLLITVGSVALILVCTSMLSKQAQQEFSGWEFDGGRVEMNREDNRLQVFFDGKPDADTRAELKSSGFRWAPSVGAWQRQLTDNAIRAADRLECIKPLSGEKPSQLQKKPSILQTMREQGEKVQTEPEKKAPSGRDAER